MELTDLISDGRGAINVDPKHIHHVYVSSVMAAESMSDPARKHQDVDQLYNTILRILAEGPQSNWELGMYQLFNGKRHDIEDQIKSLEAQKAIIDKYYDALKKVGRDPEFEEYKASRHKKV